MVETDREIGRNADGDYSQHTVCSWIQTHIHKCPGCRRCIIAGGESIPRPDASPRVTQTKALYPEARPGHSSYRWIIIGTCNDKKQETP